MILRLLNVEEDVEAMKVRMTKIFFGRKTEVFAGTIKSRFPLSASIFFLSLSKTN